MPRVHPTATINARFLTRTQLTVVKRKLEKRKLFSFVGCVVDVFIDSICLAFLIFFYCSFMLWLPRPLNFFASAALGSQIFVVIANVIIIYRIKNPSHRSSALKWKFFLLAFRLIPWSFALFASFPHSITVFIVASVVNVVYTVGVALNMIVNIRKLILLTEYVSQATNSS